MNFLNLSVSQWPKGEETIGVSPTSFSGIPYPILILMGIVFIAMLVVWWKSKRDKH
ncbi:MAG: hypothetical protein ACO1N0_09115 [Fluviicola sp.]